MIENFEKIKDTYLKDTSNEKNALSYGKALMYQHSNDEALKMFLNIKDEKLKSEAIFYAARTYCYKGNLEESEELFKTLIGTKFEGSAYYEIAQIYIKRTKRLKKKKDDLKYLAELNEKTYEYLNKSIQNKPTYKGYLSLSTQQFFDNKFEEALENCYTILSHQDWAKEKTKNYYFVKLKVAEIYYHLDRNEEAKETLSQLLEDNYENNHQIYKLLGLVYTKEKNKEKANEMIKLLNQEYDAYDLYYAYGKLCSDLQEFEEALEYFEKCDDSFMEQQANHQIAKIFYRFGEYEKAYKTYTLMLEGSAIDKNIGYLGIARCERINRNYQKAFDALDKVIKPNIQDKCELLIEKHKLFSLVGKFSESEECLKELINLNYCDFGKFEYAKFKMKNKLYNEALLMFAEIKDNEENYKWLAVVYIAKIYKYLGDFDIAKEYLLSVPNTSFDAYYTALGELIDCALDERNVDLAEKYLSEFKSAKKQKDKENYYYYSGMIAKAKGDYKLAVDYFNKIKIKDIRDYAISELAKISWKYFNDEKKATEYIYELINSETEISVAQGYYLLGNMYLELGNYDEAKKHLNYNIIKNNYRKDDSLILIATCEHLSGNYDKALELYHSLNENDNALILFDLGKLYFKQKNYEEAKKHFKKLVGLNKFNKNEALLRLAIIEYKFKNYEQALNILEDLENTGVINAAKIWKAKVYKIQNNYEEAEVILKSMLQTTNREYALLELTILEYDRGNLKLALDYINALISEGNKKEVTFGYYHKAKIYQKANNLEKAKEYFLKILNVDNLCNFKIDENEIDLDDIKLDVDKNLILLELGATEENLGNFTTAENYYKMIDNNSINWKYAMKSLIDIKIRENNYEEAEKIIYDLENQNYPDQALIGKGKLLCSKGEYEKAHECFNNVSEENNIEATYFSAKTYLSEGKIEKAKLLFEKVSLTSSEDSYHAKLYLSKIALITKDLQLAREIYENYKELLPDILLKLIYLNISQNKLSEALSDALRLFEIDEYREKAITVLIYLSKELNVVLDKKYYGNLNYVRNQILHYDKSSVRLHINSNQSKGYSCLFNPDVDINLLIDMVGPLLNEENYIYNNLFDIYVIPFKNIGFRGENYLAVQTLPNSKDIIKLYPVSTRYKEFANTFEDTEYVRKKDLS